MAPGLSPPKPTKTIGKQKKPPKNPPDNQPQSGKGPRKIRHTTKIRHNTTKIPAKAEILEDYYRVHAPKLQNIYDDKPVGALKRKPQRLPVRDTPHDDSGFEIDRLDMQVVEHIQPRPPGIFV